MLIERRVYKLVPGNLDAFWQAQIERGTDPRKRPIMARLIGYFSGLTGAADEVVHLYRYDDYDDWLARLHGAYRNPANDSYFRTARRLMTAQKNEFLVPAPVPELAALIGNGRDWLPADGPRWDMPEMGRPVVSETVYQLRPGLLKAVWERLQQTLAAAQPADLIGCFSSHVGDQHRIYVYRVEAHEGRMSDGKEFRDAIDADAQSIERRLLSAAPVAGLSPLFHQV